MNFQEPMWCRWANLVPWIRLWKKAGVGGAVGCFLDLFFDGGEPMFYGCFFMFFEIKQMIFCHMLLGGGFKYFLFSPLPGEMIQFDYCNIFQMGWNHQLVMVVFLRSIRCFLSYVFFVDSMICVFVSGVAEENVCIVPVPPETYLWMEFVPRKATTRIHRANIANSWVILFSRVSC